MLKIVSKVWVGSLLGEGQNAEEEHVKRQGHIIDWCWYPKLWEKTRNLGCAWFKQGVGASSLVLIRWCLRK